LKLEQAIASVVDAMRHHAFKVLLFFAALTFFAAFFTVQNFKINTDVSSLLDSKIEWRQREISYSKAFPQKDDLLVILVDGKDAVGSDIAAEKIATALLSEKTLFRSVKRPEAHNYFKQNGLLLLPVEQLSEVLDQLIRAQPMLGSLAKDNSLSGLFAMMDLMLSGAQAGQVSLDELTPLFSRATSAFYKALADPNDRHAWQYLFAGGTPSKFELRRFILVQPVLDYSSIAPGEKASTFIRELIKSEKLVEKYDVNIRLTGPVALADDEFSSICEGMGWSLLVSTLLIILILYLALRSIRLIIPIFIVLLCGLVITTAFALMTVTTLNLISVAFAVMFTGIAVDFGIQFGVRYRDIRSSTPDLNDAMRKTGAIVAVPLLLAALSTAAGFFSFIPTSYRGVAELGWIAGWGMLFAFILNITLLPALLRYFQPQPENEAIGYLWAAPIDLFLEKNRHLILKIFALSALVFAGLILFLRFDFDPLNLKDPSTQAVSTMFELVKDPDTNPYTIDVLLSSSEEAEQMAERIRLLPEVDKVITLLSFIPDNQDEKIALIKDTANLLNSTLGVNNPITPPSLDTEKALAKSISKRLLSFSNATGYMKELSAILDQFAAINNDDAQKHRTHFQNTTTAFLKDLNVRLNPSTVDFTDIPGDFKSDWVSAKNQSRIEIYPKANARDLDNLEKFYAAVRKIAPEATGAPVSIQESANTIKQAFIEAAVYAVIIIFILLLIILKNLRHTLYVLAPLVLAAILTLGTAALLNLPINFANIIALPLLLGLGVSYAIYFVVYWIQGHSKPLQSSMARAVLFSASTTLVAFGSLSASKHLGTGSLGILLTLSLFFVLFTTLFFLPVLLGKSNNS
jgi:hopanoid biosynthesis associated RND transporter like protein HpnN